MGILFLEYKSDHEVVYKCVHCNTPVANVNDLINPFGNTAMGAVFTFKCMFNLVIDHNGLNVQIFRGDDIFLVDTDPIPNVAISLAHEFSCRKCLVHLGWKLEKTNNFLCLKQNID